MSKTDERGLVFGIGAWGLDVDAVGLTVGHSAEKPRETAEKGKTYYAILSFFSFNEGNSALTYSYVIVKIGSAHKINKSKIHSIAFALTEG